VCHTFEYAALLNMPYHCPSQNIECAGVLIMPEWWICHTVECAAPWMCHTLATPNDWLCWHVDHARVLTVPHCWPCRNADQPAHYGVIVAIRFPQQWGTASIVYWLTYSIGMLLLSARVFSWRHPFVWLKTFTLPHDDNRAMGPPLSLGDNAFGGWPLWYRKTLVISLTSASLCSMADWHCPLTI